MTTARNGSKACPCPLRWMLNLVPTTTQSIQRRQHRPLGQRRLPRGNAPRHPAAHLREDDVPPPRRVPSVALPPLRPRLRRRPRGPPPEPALGRMHAPDAWIQICNFYKVSDSPSPCEGAEIRFLHESGQVVKQIAMVPVPNRGAPGPAQPGRALPTTPPPAQLPCLLSKARKLPY